MGLFEKEKPTPNSLCKYYMEVVGGQKELYTVKANRVEVFDGCYSFFLNEEPVAFYPIARTIIKSIELKSEE